MSLLKELAQAAKDLEKAQADSIKAATNRRNLPQGSSRAKVTTANARWMANAEHRDRVQARFDDLIARYQAGEWRQS